MPVSEWSAIVAGAETHWWEYGDPASPVTLVTVHGFRGDHHGLEPVVARLEDLRIVSPDLPGFGRSGPLPERHTVESYADWLIAFVGRVREATATPIAVLGHSFGSIVVAAALERGLAPDRVILVNPIAAPALEGPKGALSRMTLGFYRLAGALPEPLGRALLASPAIVRFMSVAMTKTRDRRLRRWIHEEHDRYFSAFATRESVIEGFEASISDNVAGHVAAFTMPTLLIGAAQDQITSVADLRALHVAMPRSELVIFDGVGHLIHYERPAEAAHAIRAHLAPLAE